MRPGAITRRQFVASSAGLGLLAGCGRLPWQAPPVKVYQLGYLASGPTESTSSPSPTAAPTLDAFRQSLRDFGYVEGQNLAVEYRVTDKGEGRLREFAAELARLPVDIILASAFAALAAKQATATVPIVFVGGADPVAIGLVASLGRPGGNVTGLPSQVQGNSLLGKRLALLQQAAPGLSRVALLADASAGTIGTGVQSADAAARALGLELQVLTVRSPDELAGAFEMAARAHTDGLLYIDSPLLARHSAQIAALALEHRLPSIGVFRQFPETGGLMAYGTSLLALNRRAAVYVDKIFKGANPADLPIEQPMTFDFVVNMKTARELGITFPNEIMLQVTEVLQ